MRLALHTDYGLRVLMYLATQNVRATIGEIAEFFGISKDHVAKVAQQLTRLEFVRGVRGAGGGLELARPAERISVGEVVRALEGNTHLLECVGARQKVCVIQPGCKLRWVLAEAERVQMDYLLGVTLADVASPATPLAQLLELSSDP